MGAGEFAVCAVLLVGLLLARGMGVYPAALAWTTLLDNTISTCNDIDEGSELPLWNPLTSKVRESLNELGILH